MANPFATAAMAAGYARSRPPLHGRIVARAAALLGLGGQVAVALDVGCGSGLSTAPLLRYASSVIGLEPVAQMVALARVTAPQASFVAASAEALPVRSGAVDLVTAAGSLNYCDCAAALREAARVLNRSGALCVYDFSQGRRFRSSEALETWFRAFVEQYPAPPAEAIALSPEILGAMSGPFRLAAQEHFEIALPMSLPAYVDYLMTETNVASAIRRGMNEAEIRSGLAESLQPVFANAVEDVSFPGYIACLARKQSS